MVCRQRLEICFCHVIFKNCKNSIGFQNSLAQRFAISDCSSKDSSMKWALQSWLVKGLKTSEWMFFTAFVHSLAKWDVSGHLYRLTPSLWVLEYPPAIQRCGIVICAWRGCGHGGLFAWAGIKIHTEYGTQLNCCAINPITLYCLKWLLDIRKRTYTRDHWYKKFLKFPH